MPRYRLDPHTSTLMRVSPVRAADPTAGEPKFLRVADRGTSRYRDCLGTLHAKDGTAAVLSQLTG